VQQRHLGKLFGLMVLTLGIYHIYWLVLTRRELIHQTKEEIPPVWASFLPWGLFVVFTSIGMLTTATTGADSQSSILMHFLTTLGMGAFLAGLVIPLMWIWRYGKAIENLTGGETTRRYVFWMWILAMGAWPLMMQHELNVVVSNHHKAQVAGPSKKSKKKAKS